MKEGLFYKQLKGPGNTIQCILCPQYCVMKDNEIGKCQVRQNKGGTLYTLVYGRAASRAVDPIEKKPLFHFLPGSKIYSMATFGCNMGCKFCQNADISQSNAVELSEEMSPSEVIEDVIRYGCDSIAYTYNEPTIFYEYVLDCAKLAHKAGIKNVLVSNGFINPVPLKYISKYIDAINIDLKSFNNDYYKKVTDARLKPVLEAIKLYYKMGVFLELTTLVIPGKNDSDSELSQIAEFIHSISPDIPWHVSAFHPDYKMMDIPRTPVETLNRAVKIGKKAGLNYVYAGNIPGNDYESTFCPNCNTKLIDRYLFTIRSNIMERDNCPKCGEKINIIVKTNFKGLDEFE